MCVCVCVTFLRRNFRGFVREYSYVNVFYGSFWIKCLFFYVYRRKLCEYVGKGGDYAYNVSRHVYSSVIIFSVNIDLDEFLDTTKTVLYLRNPT